jgi:alpha-L-fucosidase
MPYEATWESIDRRPVPDWFTHAKFGIFIHWGPYSVPAWGKRGTYAEWYWHELIKKDEDTRRFHYETYGEDFKYQDFAAQFRAELFDPAQWAALFADAGARYIVLTSKHHDGFCLWPSAQSWNWNSVDIGPHRDLCGDLGAAVKAQGIRMGYYYSLYEWFHPHFVNDLPRYVDEHMLPQLKDLAQRYEPALVWTDGEWDIPSDQWRSVEYLAWLFNDSPVRDEVVVNDRWGKECRSVHGGIYTTEYGEVGFGAELAAGKPWEECRGIGASFGFNRNENVDDYLSAEALVHLLVDTVAKGGNLLLNIGPTADGRIPVIQEERLRQLGAWLKVNGEAIYDSQFWKPDAESETVRYTTRDGNVYTMSLEWPGDTLTLTAPKLRDNATVTLLGSDQPLEWKSNEKGVTIDTRSVNPIALDTRHAYTFRLTGAA